MTKPCNTCKIEKPLTEYFKDKSYRSGYHSMCKECKTAATLKRRVEKRDDYNAYMKNYRATHPNKEAEQIRSRKKLLKSRYGITTGEYEEMKAAQDGVCAICGESPENHVLYVDHDHVTNFVRGLLCASCNRSIAILDNSDLLQKAASYLGIQVEIKKSVD